jgi:hypothetical protein
MDDGRSPTFLFLIECLSYLIVRFFEPRHALKTAGPCRISLTKTSKPDPFDSPSSLALILIFRLFGFSQAGAGHDVLSRMRRY